MRVRRFQYLGFVLASALALSSSGQTATVPVPVPAASQPQRVPGTADLDPENDEVVAPPDLIPNCDELLRQSGVRYRPAELPIRPKTASRPMCGAEQVVVYMEGPGKIRFSPPPLVTCGMALALARFEIVAQEEADHHFGKRIVRVGQMGTYSCRKMTRFEMVSEHSYANAIDLTSFRLADGRLISVEKHFGNPQRPASTPASEFLRSLAHRLFDERVFSVVLTSHFDALHKNHFHVDLARYRVDGTR